MRGKQLLGQTITDALIPGLLMERASWRPYPPAVERAAWLALPESVREAQIERAREAARVEWPHLPADVYLQFAKNGNRSNFEALYFRRRDLLTALVIGECMHGAGEWLPMIANQVWWLCEESSWCLPAHIGAQRAGPGLPDVAEPVVDLFASETGALLAWTVYLLGEQLDAIHPEICSRAVREVDLRVLTPALERDDWWWMGIRERPVNNWNPWICSNWLVCALLLEDDGMRRAASVSKIARCLDNFINDYPDDGGCDEGPSYWGRAGASLFDCLELLHSASGGRIDLFGVPLIQEIGRFVYRAHIAEDYYLNFADAPAVMQPEAMLVLRFGERIGDEQMMRFGAWLAERADLLERGYRALRVNRSASLLRELPGLFGLNALTRTQAAPPLLRDVWLPDTQVMAARDQAGSEKGLYLAAKGGHNAESHNHNDVGHFVVYKDGRPLIIDAGVETYTRKTFSDHRYEIWTMQSAYHSLPTVGGVMQAAGRAFAARDVRYTADEQASELTLDISGAYPPEAGILRWQRRLRLDRGRQVVLRDAFALSEALPVSLSLLTCSQPVVISDGRVRLDEVELVEGRFSGAGEIHYAGGQFEVAVEEITIEDARLGPIWGQRVYRLVFNLLKTVKTGDFEIKVG